VNLTFRQLRVFTEVVRQGSIQRAAEHLHLTPPAVSMQIKEIENQVGLALFDRSLRCVRINEVLAAAWDIEALPAVGRPISEVLPPLAAPLAATGVPLARVG